MKDYDGDRMRRKPTLPFLRAVEVALLISNHVFVCIFKHSSRKTKRTTYIEHVVPSVHKRAETKNHGMREEDRNKKKQALAGTINTKCRHL